MDKKFMENFKSKIGKLKIDEKFFENLNEKIKGKEFYFSLGFFSIKLNLKKDVFYILSKKFENKRGEFFVEPEAYKSPIDNFKYKSGRPEFYSIDFIENGRKLIFYAYNFASMIDLKNTDKAFIAIGKTDAKTLSSEIENFLRVYSGLILPKFNSFLFHSSSVVIGKSAYVFFGLSGAGKSTIANIFKDEGFPVLSDDLNILIFKDGLKIMASPYLSEIDKAEEGIYPIKKFFYLKKDKKNYIEKISPLTQRAYIYSSLPVLNSIKFFQEEIFFTISNIIKLKEVEVLHFKKDKEVVKWLQSV
jgi:hypothetical protein